MAEDINTVKITPPESLSDAPSAKGPRDFIPTFIETYYFAFGTNRKLPPDCSCGFILRTTVPGFPSINWRIYNPATYDNAMGEILVKGVDATYPVDDPLSNNCPFAKSEWLVKFLFSPNAQECVVPPIKLDNFKQYLEQNYPNICYDFIKEYYYPVYVKKEMISTLRNDIYTAGLKWLGRINMSGGADRVHDAKIFGLDLLQTRYIISKFADRGAFRDVTKNQVLEMIAYLKYMLSLLPADTSSFTDSDLESFIKASGYNWYDTIVHILARIESSNNTTASIIMEGI